MASQSELLNALFRAQSGVASIAQAQSLGIALGSIKRRLRTGEFIVVHPGVVRPACVPETWSAQLIAAALFLGPRAVASHLTAARLLGFPGFEIDPAIEFTTLRQNRGIGGSIRVHSARRMEDVDTMRCALPLRSDPHPAELAGLVHVIDRVGVTTPARTIIDLSNRLKGGSLARLVDDCVARRLLSVEVLSERLELLRDSGVRGVRRLDKALVDAGVESWLERRFLELMRDAGLPRPACQVVFGISSGKVARVDFAVTGTNVLIEVSGRRGHVTDEERLKDARRRNDLQAMGHKVLEFTTTMVVKDPAYVVRSVREALRQAGLDV